MIYQERWDGLCLNSLGKKQGGKKGNRKKWLEGERLSECSPLPLEGWVTARKFEGCCQKPWGQISKVKENCNHNFLFSWNGGFLKIKISFFRNWECCMLEMLRCSCGRIWTKFGTSGAKFTVPLCVPYSFLSACEPFPVTLWSDFWKGNKKCILWLTKVMSQTVKSWFLSYLSQLARPYVSLLLICCVLWIAWFFTSSWFY